MPSNSFETVDGLVHTNLSSFSSFRRSSQRKQTALLWLSPPTAPGGLSKHLFSSGWRKPGCSQVPTALACAHLSGKLGLAGQCSWALSVLYTPPSFPAGRSSHSQIETEELEPAHGAALRLYSAVLILSAGPTCDPAQGRGDGDEVKVRGWFPPKGRYPRVTQGRPWIREGALLQTALHALFYRKEAQAAVCSWVSDPPSALLADR